MNENNSIDKLVEFGLGVSVARQMIHMMNSTMQSMCVPGQTINQPKQKEWFVAIDRKPSGPYSGEDMKKLLLDKKLEQNDLVWCSGMREWQQAKNVPEILKMIIQLPPSL